jgi:hypothetical protein
VLVDFVRFGNSELIPITAMPTNGQPGIGILNEKDMYFIRQIEEGGAKVPPWDLVLAVVNMLEASGYTLDVAHEDTWIFDKVKEEIREKGISYVHYIEFIAVLQAEARTQLKRVKDA